MPITEAELKKRLKEGLAPLYFLYGAESYLTAHYAAQIAEKAVGKDDMGGFNLQKLDGGAFKDKPLPQAQCLIQHMPHDVCSMLGL